jgi:DNA-binding IclR family transcriptional regulator
LTQSSADSGIVVVDRVVALLDALASGRSSPVKLAQETGIARSSVYRIAAALQKYAVVQRTESGEFVLGMRVLSWGAAAMRGISWLPEIQEAIGLLHEETGESVQFYVRDGRERLCVAAIDRPTGLGETVPVGSRLSLTAGSGAKVLLAWSDDRLEFPDMDQAELERTRIEGTAYSIAEREVGLASVSAAVMIGPDRLLGALTVSGPMQRITGNMEQLRRAASRAAQRLSISWAGAARGADAEPGRVASRAAGG